MGSVLIQTGGASKNNLVSYLSNKNFSLSQKDLDGCYSVGDYVFYNNTYLTSIDMSYGIMKIGEHAFDGCSNLTEIHIPGSVGEIGDYALANCSNLSTIYYGGLQSSWNDLPKGAHWDDNTSGYNVVCESPNYNCISYTWDNDLNGYAATLVDSGDEIAVIPDKIGSTPVVKLAGTMGNKMYKGVVIPSSITTLSECAVGDCVQLISLTIPNSVNTIVNESYFSGFRYDSISGPAIAVRALTGSSFHEAKNYFITRRDDYAVDGPKYNHYIVVPDDTTTIPSDLKNVISFSDEVTPNQKVIIPNGVTTIGTNSITNVVYAEIPDSIVSLPTDFFLSGVHTNKVKCNTKAAITILNNYNGTNIYPINVILVNSTSDSNQALNTDKLYSLTFDETITDVDKFLGATSLAEIHFNGSARYWFNLEKPKKYSFIYINGKLLRGDYIFPSNVSKIKLNSFMPGTGFTSITLGDELSYFEGTYADIRGPYPDDPSSILDICTYSNGAYYLGSSSNQYLVLVKGDTTSTYCYINSGCKIILGGAFRNNTTLQEIDIPNSVEFIGDYAFYGCKNAGLMNYSGAAYELSHLKYIGKGAFGLVYSNYFNGFGMWSFPSLKQGEDKIRDYAFLGDKLNLIPSSVQEVGQLVASNDVVKFGGTLEQWLNIDGPSVMSATLPSSKSVLSNYVDTTIAAPFCKHHTLHLNSCVYNSTEYYTEPVNIDIPETITEIKNYAFALCDSLQSVHIGSHVNSVGVGAFAECTNLVSVTLSEYVDTIPESMFEGCTSLTSITIPQCVLGIRSNAFKNCTNLTSFTYQGTMDRWGYVVTETDWNSGAGFSVVHCTDGDINL